MRGLQMDMPMVMTMARVVSGGIMLRLPVRMARVVTMRLRLISRRARVIGSDRLVWMNMGQMFNHADQIQVAMVDPALGANGIGQA